MKTFINANSAFRNLFNEISKTNKINSHYGTKYILNCGFYITNPLDNEITIDWRKWNKEYAEYEWQWYLSGNPNADEIAKRAKIWQMCQDENGCVNSNYGYQWNRGINISQLDYVVNELNSNPNSRRAVISIYDGKESHLYSKDTPCTLAINFFIEEDKLEISVFMRSNDLVFGFCNDQYCFSNLQKMIADKLNISIGGYYHFATNMHIYQRHWDMNKK